jgi:phosphonate transport system substrate-binding protein
MLKLIAFVLSTILSLSTVTAFASDLSPVKPLEVGIIPYLSPRALVTNYEPMRLYLENSLGRPVKIYTAISFRQFLINAQHGDYDLVFAAAHIARMLEHDQKYKPVARFATKNHTLIMVAKDSLIKNVNDLKGKVLAVPDFMSLSSIIAISYLREAGLMAGRDFKIQEVPSFNAAISNVQLNEAAAAITATNIIATRLKVSLMRVYRSE